MCIDLIPNNPLGSMSPPPCRGKGRFGPNGLSGFVFQLSPNEKAEVVTNCDLAKLLCGRAV